MTDAKPQPWFEKRWKLGTFAAWLTVSAILLVGKWADIQAFALRDTDDNLRLAQVRAWIEGQGWFDLVQHRLAPPWGADIHWSRLVDLPIAGLALLFRPVVGTPAAEQWAAALAPLLPLAAGLFALALIARRTLRPDAWPLALLIACCAPLLVPMWTPLRIDHHGWQLALLAWAAAGLTDRNAVRGGIASGLASALSLAIGLEMLALLGLVGAATALFWIRDRREGPRLAGYGATLAGGTALGFALFASSANRAPVCDALSPVWLSLFAAGGGLLVALAFFRAERAWVRLGAAGAAGAVLVAGFALLWPDCLARPEGVSAELRALWLDNVREARPVLQAPWRGALLIAALPAVGLAGYALALREARGEALARWLALTGPAVAAAALVFWQMRFAPAAQLLAVPGAAALGVRLFPLVRGSASMALRVCGTLLALLLVTGLYAMIFLALLPADESEGARASGPCSTRTALAPLAELPRSTILAPIDLGPRLIVMTPHDAVAGPYHRNGDDILAVLGSFRSPPEEARTIVDRYGIGYVLLCPGLSEERIYRETGEGSLFAVLDGGDPPPWLERVPLPEGSPLRVWRVR